MTTVVLNPAASNGRALKRWEDVRGEVRERVGDFTLVQTRPNADLAPDLAPVVAGGCRRFVAAGGDGTVNTVLEALVACGAGAERFQLGAIGLGSSNDFHKPYESRALMRAYPCRIDFGNTLRRDVGSLWYRDLAGAWNCRHWIINSSVGATADANAFFNNGSAVVHALKRRATGLAILYAATTTILRHRNYPVRIAVDGGMPRSLELSNIGIVKSPHFSGDLRYDTPFEPASGAIYVNAAEGLTRAQLLRLLVRLARGRFQGTPGTWTRRAFAINIESELPLAFEFDGEVVHGDRAEFSVSTIAIEVCS